MLNYDLCPHHSARLEIYESWTLDDDDVDEASTTSFVGTQKPVKSGYRLAVAVVVVICTVPQG